MSENEPDYLGIPIKKVEELIGVFVKQHIVVQDIQEHGVRTVIIPWSSVPERGPPFDWEELGDLIDNAIDPNLN